MKSFAKDVVIEQERKSKGIEDINRDLESVFNVNAWICACQTTDRDLETKK